MKMEPICIKCIIDCRLREILSTNASTHDKIKAEIELLRIGFEEFSAGGELTVLATRIYHRLIALFPAVINYYKHVKEESIHDALKILPIIRDRLNKLDGYDRFIELVKISIIGNYLDTGVMEHNPPSVEQLISYIDKPLVIDHTREFYDIVKEGKKKIVWLFDNAGESVLDILLIEFLRQRGNYIIGLAKEDPGFQNDLTISDAYFAGLDKYLDELISTGYPGSSIHLDEINNEAKRAIKDSDLLIAKGMAHWEYLSEINLGKPVIHLLVPKCSVIAEKLSVPRYSLIALMRK